MESRLGSALDGRYNIDREIGRGGMATVFLARDVRHNRNVALKVLSPELGAVLGVERFLAEIQVTANLQHPNLLPLFDSGEANGLLFYVMPYVEGESLRARLLREKQLPVDEAVRIATAIAGALDYAHRHKVIHRDLKPENVLMHEGQPLIADFGIALAVSIAGGARVTQTGISLGTPQYMSPEQATGDRVVDGRTDIYSLGAMTYEMLVGDPPHNASTAQSIIAKVLTEKPASVRMARPNVSPHVEAAVGRALEKLAADRYSTAKEFADAIEGKGSATTSTAYAPAAPASGARRTARIREFATWTLVAILASWAGWRAMQSAPEGQVVRVNYDLPPGVRIQDVIVGSTIAVSPKGDMMAFTGISLSGFRIYVRHFNELAAREISTSAGRNLTFSPDGHWLAFTEGSALYKVSVESGQQSAVTASTPQGLVYGIAWKGADSIYLGGFSGLWVVPAGGGTVAPVRQDSTRKRVGQRWPVILPGGKLLVFAGSNSSAETPRLSVMSLGTGTVTEFDVQAAVPLGMLGEQLIYVSPAGGLMAVRFDLGAARPIGEPTQVDEGVLVDPTGGAKASLSESGTLAYLRGRAQLQPMLIAATGTPTPIGEEPGIYSYPRLSPDGTLMAITAFSGSATDVWIRDLARNTFTRLTVEGTNSRPEWSPDGRHVLFISSRDGKAGIWRRLADASGPAELVYQPEVEPFEAILSPDSKWLIFRTAPGSKYSRDILAVPLTSERTVKPLVMGPMSETMMRLSPDGKWLAYQSNESGRTEVYVRPFPENGARITVSDNGATEAVWARNGRALFYRGPTGEVIKVDVTTGARFSIGQRRIVLTGNYITDASHASYDVAPDGRFLMLKRAGAEAQTIVVHNWGRELREKTAPKR